MKAGFEVYPECRPYKQNAEFCELCEDWYFEADGARTWLPKFYYYDGASIPRIFWSLIGSPFQPDFWAAALAHDWIYLVHAQTRAEADEILFQLLRCAGVSLWKARIIWAAVRSCGALAWHNNENDKREIDKIRYELTEREDREKFII